MAYYRIRNLKMPLPDYNYMASMYMIAYRWLLWLADWTETSIDADTAYNVGNSMAVDETSGTPGNGFVVAAASPGLVYDPLGRFTASMATYGYIIFLKASTASNRGAYKIVQYVDANNILVDLNSTPPGGWTDEVDISGKILGGSTAGANRWTTSGSGAISGSKSALYTAPSGVNQLRLYHSSSYYLYAYGRPNGTATEVGGDALYTNSNYECRVDGYFEDPNFFTVLREVNQSGNHRILFTGTLTDADAGDTNPNFLYYSTDAWGAAYMMITPFRMLDNAGTPASINGYAVFTKRSNSVNGTSGFYMLPAFRITLARTAVTPIYLCLSNVATGGFIRGKIPVIRQCNQYAPECSPIDGVGAWQHLYKGMAIPRSGPNDQRLIFAK